MNTFNRVVVVLLCLILMFGAAAVTALAWGGPDESIDWLRDAATWLEERNTDGTKFIITTAAVTVSMIALAVLITELYPRAAGRVKVTDLQAGDAVLSTAAIGQRVEEAVTGLPNVADARASVKAKRKGVVVDLDLHVDPDADLVSVIDDANEATRGILAEKVHVTLIGPPRTRIHYRELRLRGRPARRQAMDAKAGASAVEAEAEDASETAAQPEPEAASKA